MYSVCPQVVPAASRLRSYGTEICSMFAERLASANLICWVCCCLVVQLIGTPGAGSPSRAPPCSPTGPGAARPGDQDDKSRMSREAHVRICGGRGAQFPPATRRHGAGIDEAPATKFARVSTHWRTPTCGFIVPGTRTGLHQLLRVTTGTSTDSERKRPGERVRPTLRSSIMSGVLTAELFGLPRKGCLSARWSCVPCVSWRTHHLT